VRYTYALDIADTERMVAGMDSDVRRQSRRATERGYATVAGSETQAAALAQLVAATYARQELPPPLPLERLTALIADLVATGIGRLMLAGQPGQPPTAGALHLVNGEQGYYFLGGADQDRLASGANQLLFIEGLRRLADDGVHRFDFCGADLPSIAAYKATFGGQLVPHFKVYSYASPLTRALTYAQRRIGG
jgi:lipid II:glycine glycyltransferase (peptidoglycan interpeptide bridge formation enzyme)